jgi:hypothetical protein
MTRTLAFARPALAPLFLATMVLASGCRTGATPPPPVFTWDIPLPVNDGQSGFRLDMVTNSQVVVPVTLIAHDRAIEVTMSMDYEEGFPDDLGVTFSTPYENISLAAGEQHISKITFTASPGLASGSYRTHLVGKLKEDASGAGGLASQIDILVLESSNGTEK